MTYEFHGPRWLRRERGRILDLTVDADGGVFIYQEDDPAAQSIVLTTAEVRWLAMRLPLILLRIWWLRDGGASDRLDAFVGPTDE